MTANQGEYAKLDQPEILNVLFHPRGALDSKPPAGATDLGIPADEGVRLSARFYQAATESPNILLFHGNSEIVNDYDFIGPLYNEQGLNLLVVDYRGYGKSGGKPTVTAMLNDAHTVFADFKEWLAAAQYTGPLIIMGRSLGCTCALELAAAHADEIAALIIESGFSTTMQFLLSQGIDPAALDITEEDGFNNVRKIERFTKPTLIIHAQNDEFIPVQHVGILHAQCIAKSKEFQIVPGAKHNTIMARTGRMYFEVIKQFINKALCIKPKRNRRDKQS